MATNARKVSPLSYRPTVPSEATMRGPLDPTTDHFIQPGQNMNSDYFLSFPRVLSDSRGSKSANVPKWGGGFRKPKKGY